MQRTSGDWYLVLIVAAITALTIGAVFYISVWTLADPEWFKTIATGGVGALLALLTQKVVADPKPPDVAPPAPSPSTPPAKAPVKVARKRIRKATP